MLSKKTREPKFKKSLPAKSNKLEKIFFHKDDRKVGKMKKYPEFLSWFHEQGFKCLECGTRLNVEAHHVIPSDDSSVVPFCSYCHRGDEKQNRPIVKPYHSLQLSNTSTFVVKGFYLHRGTESHAFSLVHPDDMLLQKAREFYHHYLSKD